MSTAVPNLDALRAALKDLSDLLSENEFNHHAAKVAALECSKRAQILQQEVKSFELDTTEASRSTQRAEKDTAYLRAKANALRLRPTVRDSHPDVGNREENAVRQVLVQAAVHKRAVAVNDALAVSLRINQVQPRSKGEQEFSSQEMITSLAQKFFFELKGTEQAQDAICHNEQSLAAQFLAVPDQSATNVTLSRSTLAAEQSYCCAFTTRKAGVVARIRAEDHNGTARQNATIRFSADLYLGNACDLAAELYNTGNANAGDLVRRVFWPAIAKNKLR